MFDLLYGFEVSQALFAAARLDLATLLQAGPRTAEDLAAACGAQAGPLRRLLRVLASLGVFTTAEPGTFALTPLGGTLAAGTPGSMREVALMCMDLNYGSFGKLLDTLTTGTAGSQTYLGRPLFDWLADHPLQQEQFTGAMQNLAANLALRALSAYQLPPGDVVADIGGADGTILSALLAGDPDEIACATRAQRRCPALDLRMTPAGTAHLPPPLYIHALRNVALVCRAR
jgi:hypothetical protein